MAGQPFTDDDPLLAGTTIKAVHVTELRSRIDAVRRRAGLPDLNWPAISIGTTTATAQHLQQMRDAVNDVFVVRGRTPTPYTDPILSPGMTPVRASHILELRSNVKALELQFP
jgi:hypothetical protein